MKTGYLVTCQPVIGMSFIPIKFFNGNNAEDRANEYAAELHEKTPATYVVRPLEYDDGVKEEVVVPIFCDGCKECEPHRTGKQRLK
jgi:hypothetical protein